ncbi:DUF1543 domain-containing protein [Cedecea davisae]|uniref:DUF1543 domain-containing protein n=1 Tax=Cedecea davisae TaxID=158484 RepID=UPI00242C4390|nr:DUF1543 domain-containing protein [Cedecea davisae]
MELYVFYVGGNAGKSNIEVHDVQFVAAEKPEDAWPALRSAWFGDKDKIHIDGFGKLRWADGYRISLSTTPVEQSQKLFFVNAGGYSPETLAELHEFDFFVATSAAEAKEKALARLLVNSYQQHKDNLKDVDDCLFLENVGDYFVRLEKTEQGERFRPEWQGYLPIGE